MLNNKFAVFVCTLFTISWQMLEYIRVYIHLRAMNKSILFIFWGTLNCMHDLFYCMIKARYITRLFLSINTFVMSLVLLFLQKKTTIYFAKLLYIICNCSKKNQMISLLSDTFYYYFTCIFTYYKFGFFCEIGIRLIFYTKMSLVIQTHFKTISLNPEVVVRRWIKTKLI